MFSILLAITCLTSITAAEEVVTGHFLNPMWIYNNNSFAYQLEASIVTADVTTTVYAVYCNANYTTRDNQNLDTSATSICRLGQATQTVTQGPTSEHISLNFGGSTVLFIGDYTYSSLLAPMVTAVETVTQVIEGFDDEPSTTRTQAPGSKTYGASDNAQIMATELTFRFV